MTERNATAAPRKDPKTETWWFIVDAGIGPDGKRRQAKRRGFKTKKAAQEELDKLRRSVTTVTYVAPAKQTLTEYLSEWVEGLPTQGLRPSTVESYSRVLHYVTGDLGAKRLDALTPQDLDKLYSHLLASGRRRGVGGLSPRSVRYIHTVLSKALSDAVKKGTLSRNVAQLADPPSEKSTKAPEQSWWTPEQLRQFIAFTADDAYGPLFHVASMTGMRRGEVCGLRWSDVDLDAAVLNVRQQLNVVRGQPDGGLVFSEWTKTERGQRAIALDAGTVAVLKTLKRRQKEQRFAMGAGWRNDRGLVFTQPDGSPVNPEAVAKLFARRVCQAELPPIRFHDLRHTHCSHLIESGTVPILAISRRLGHASVAFTLTQYGHLTEDAGADAANAVGLRRLSVTTCDQSVTTGPFRGLPAGREVPLLRVCSGGV